MHPFASYLVVIDRQREERLEARELRRLYAPVDALPLAETTVVPRGTRLSNTLRALVAAGRTRRGAHRRAAAR